jgi:hypothetical protein
MTRTGRGRPSGAWRTLQWSRPITDWMTILRLLDRVDPQVAAMEPAD